MASEGPRRQHDRDTSPTRGDRVVEGQFHQRQAGEEIRSEGDEHGSGAERRPTEARQGSVITKRPMTRVLVAGIMLVVLGFALAALVVFWGVGAPE